MTDVHAQPAQRPTHPRGDVPAVEVVDLRRRYGDVEAVCGISFEVHPGGVFALLGVNGAGKTSALEPRPPVAPRDGACPAGGPTRRGVRPGAPAADRARAGPLAFPSPRSRRRDGSEERPCPGNSRC